MNPFRRDTPELKAEKHAAKNEAKREAAEIEATLGEFRQVRDRQLGTGRRTKWPTCGGCGETDGWYIVGALRHVRAPNYSPWWNGGSSTVATQRFACIHCKARADLVRYNKGYAFLAGPLPG